MRESPAAVPRPGAAAGALFVSPSPRSRQGTMIPEERKPVSGVWGKITLTRDVDSALTEAEPSRL